jgi:hypothetical protein
MIGGVMGIMSSRSIRKRDQAARQEYDEMWTTFVAITELTNSGRGNAWKPQPGSKEHKLAEKMVEKGWLSRQPFGAYMLRSSVNPGGAGDSYASDGLY